MRRSLVALLLLAGCPGEDPPTAGTPTRTWRFEELPADGGAARLLGEGERVGGTLLEEAGPGAVGGSGDGLGIAARSAEHGGKVVLEQRQSFRKRAGEASLALAVSNLALEVTDESSAPDLAACPWARGFSPWCFDELYASLALDVSVRTASGELQGFAGEVRLVGWQGSWDPDVFATRGAAFWDDDDFGFDGARLAGHAPLIIAVDLSGVAVGEEITLIVRAEAVARGRRGGSSSAAVALEGQVNAVGLDATNRPLLGEAVPALPAPECASDPALGGVLHLDAGTYFGIERPLATQPILVRRSGSRNGVVSATLTLEDGSATAGQDYQAVTTTVSFGDGDDLPRLVHLPILADALAEGDETLRITLSEPSGCAALGAPASATFTILGVDAALPSPRSVGGTVSGLAGPGLRLTNQHTDLNVGADGPFAFAGRWAEGTPYDVRVAANPASQTCTVARGTGTIGDADVTDVEVTCVTAPLGSGLDPSWGVGGKVTAGPFETVTAMALAPDGKLVVVGGLQVARYLDDGRLDPDFGDAGLVSLAFGPILSDRLYGVAVQPDGRIVVVGSSSDGTFLDFAVARLLDDGDLDPSFDGDGKLTTDFAGNGDRAVAVAIQPDSAIVVGGLASFTGVGGDFAVARYTASGALDETFGGDGKVTTNIAGSTDLGAALVLLPDGRIVLGGRVANGGAANPDFGLVRYLADGTLDTSFDGDGIVRADVSAGNWDQLDDLVLQPDGKLVAVGQVHTATGTMFGVVRFEENGAIDPGFGVVTTSFGTGNHVARSVALAPDGKIVVFGYTSGVDMAVARYLGNGALDSSFFGDGTLTVDFFGATDGAADGVLQADGKLVCGGSARNGSFTLPAIARITP